MSRYRKVEVRIWNDAKFRALSDDAKLLFMLILTHPNLTRLGAMRASVRSLSYDLDWTVKRTEKPFGELLRKGLVGCDEDGGGVWLPSFIRLNPPANPNVLTSMMGDMELIPEGPAQAYALSQVVMLPERFPKRFQLGSVQAWRNRFDRVSPQEQEQEQYQEQEQKNPPTPLEKGGGLDHFTSFYDSYPRKVKRPDAEKAWRQVRGDAIAQEVIAGVDRWRRSAEWEGGRIHYPATFLRGRMWEDIPSPPAVGKTTEITRKNLEVLEYVRQREEANGRPSIEG